MLPVFQILLNPTFLEVPYTMHIYTGSTYYIDILLITVVKKQATSLHVLRESLCSLLFDIVDIFMHFDKCGKIMCLQCTGFVKKCFFHV